MADHFDCKPDAIKMNAIIFFIASEMIATHVQSFWIPLVF